MSSVSSISLFCPASLQKELDAWRKQQKAVLALQMAELFNIPYMLTPDFSRDKILAIEQEVTNGKGRRVVFNVPPQVVKFWLRIGFKERWRLLFWLLEAEPAQIIAMNGIVSIDGSEFHQPLKKRVTTHSDAASLSMPAESLSDEIKSDTPDKDDTAEPEDNGSQEQITAVESESRYEHDEKATEPSNVEDDSPSDEPKTERQPKVEDNTATIDQIRAQVDSVF